MLNHAVYIGKNHHTGPGVGDPREERGIGLLQRALLKGNPVSVFPMLKLNASPLRNLCGTNCRVHPCRVQGLIPPMEVPSSGIHAFTGAQSGGAKGSAAVVSARSANNHFTQIRPRAKGSGGSLAGGAIPVWFIPRGFQNSSLKKSSRDSPVTFWIAIPRRLYPAWEYTRRVPGGKSGSQLERPPGAFVGFWCRPNGHQIPVASDREDRIDGPAVPRWCRRVLFPEGDSSHRVAFQWDPAVRVFPRATRR